MVSTDKLFWTCVVLINITIFISLLYLPIEKFNISHILKITGLSFIFKSKTNFSSEPEANSVQQQSFYIQEGIVIKSTIHALLKKSG